MRSTRSSRGSPPLYGEVPGLQGVWATDPSIEFCRENLEEVITDWVIFRVAHKLPIPDIDSWMSVFHRIADRWI